MINLSKEDIARLKQRGAKVRSTAPKPAVEKKAAPVAKPAPIPKAQPDNSKALALHEKTAKMAQDISISSAEVVSKLAGAMEKMIKEDKERKPHPYRFVIERDKKSGVMTSVTATPMGQKG